MFSRERRLKKQMEDAKANNRRMQRELERDQRQLQRDEAQLKVEIKRLAAQGDKKSCAVLARQLVKIRQNVTRSKEMGAWMNGITTQQSMFLSNMRIADAAKTGTSVMTKMNKGIEKAGGVKAMQRYSKECMRMSMAEEAMDNALNTIFDDSGEEDAVVQEILDELGIETNERMPSIPQRSLGSIGNLVTDKESTDIMEQLERLRSP